MYFPIETMVNLQNRSVWSLTLNLFQNLLSLEKDIGT